jgi:diguanylate cyclase (GGDEF)-like protein/PAS domain S-box-containing protein
MKNVLHNTRMLVMGFGVVVILMMLIMLFSLVRIGQSRGILEDSITEHQGCIVLIDKMYSASRKRMVVLQKIATETDPFVQDEYINEFRDLATQFIESREALLARDLRNSELEFMESQRNIANHIVPLQAEVIDLALSGKHLESQIMLVNQVMPAHSEMLETLVGLSSIQTTELARAMDETKQNESNTIALLVTVGGATVLLAILVAGVVVRNMGRMTKSLAVTAESLQSSLRELQYQKQSLDEHAIVSVTDADGTLTYVNAKFCGQSQYRIEELLGKTHRVISSGTHSKNFFEMFWQTIKSGQVWHGQICNRRKDGGLYWMDTTVVPFLDEAGKPYQYVGVQTDITASKEAETVLARGKQELEQLVADRTQELQERQSLLQEITTSAQDAIVIVDDSDVITFWNQAAERIFGYASHEVMGRKLHDLIMPPRYRMDFERGFSGFIKNGEGQFVGKLREVVALRRDGNEFPMELALSSAKIKGRWLGIGLARDITSRKQAEEALRLMALTDPLTGVANRRKLDTVLEMEVQRAGRYHFPLTLILFDIDHFKSINDTYGHPAGDAVLRNLATLVSGNLRATDLFARWGGEEFAILATNSNLAVGQSCAEKIRVMIEDFSFSDVGRVTCSFGVTELRAGESVVDFTSRTDKALYMAKSVGRNRVEVI